MAYLYGVFVGKKWGMTKNKRRAIAAARKENGSVYAIPLPPMSERNWDAPTFRAVADLIWPIAPVKLPFEAACARFVHRYTMEHIPQWARQTAPNGKYYAPQFRTDREWYDRTEFPPRRRHCETSGQTWPLGQWLDTPYAK